jgi:4-aminobutyrate aminotransferase-like enzyme
MELVQDPKSRKPAPDRASYIVERMKSRGILLSTDGPFHNVIKFKPPMVFSAIDAGVFESELARVLCEEPLV